jgi:hypothetical protein
MKIRLHAAGSLQLKFHAGKVLRVKGGIHAFVTRSFSGQDAISELSRTT